MEQSIAKFHNHAWQEKTLSEESHVEVYDPCDTSCEDVPTIMSVETVTTGETESDPDPEEETPDAGGSEQSSSKPMVIVKSDIEEIKSEGMSESGSTVNLRSYLDTDSEEEDD